MLATSLLFAAPWSPASAQPPSAVQTELERLEREKEAALRPVIQASQQRLAQMQAEFTKAGRLDEAVAARDALEQLKTGNGEANRLAGTTWSRKPDNIPNKGYVKLLASGLAKSADGGWESAGLVTRWEHVGGRVVLLTIEKGRSDHLCEVWLFDPQWKSYKGFAFDGVRVEGSEAKEK
ncbi:hypothetical protein [Roseimicrobium sp. ORNL1]|uniref:hypothetical protein n=1 Tax=Roseimicrobium sp. ORNL1 TaxID=2711231 RepID=UPI0019818888|nr:hypothetical protein [Roseimicrobium sp. ORNL1]